MITTRYIKATHPAVIRAFLPGAKRVRYEVTDEEFDEIDMLAPGVYDGVYVTTAVAAKWDAGIQACKAAGIGTLTREGLALRLVHARGPEARMPPALEQLLEAREARERAEQEAEQAARAAQAAWLALSEGYVDVGATAYAGQWWPWEARQSLPVVAKRVAVNDRDKAQHPYHIGRELRRTPDGDLVRFDAGSFAHLTRDPARIADARMRRAIVAYQYTPALYEALCTLEQQGALRTACSTWFGGLPPAKDREKCQQGAFSGPLNATGPEMVERLLARIDECLAQGHPVHAEALRAARALVVPGSIVALTAGEFRL